MCCKVCGRRIKGNAGLEQYDAPNQQMEYTCKKCVKLFLKMGAPHVTNPDR